MPSLWAWVGPSDLCPMEKKTQQNCLDGISKIRLQDCDFSPAGTLSVSSHFCSDEANCHVMSCPMEMPTWKGTEGGLKPTSPEELNASNHLGSELGWSSQWNLNNGCNPSTHFEYSLRERPWARGASQAAPGFLTHRNWHNKHCCVKW